MGDVSMVSLIVRMLVSLGLVLALVGIAYVIARRRSNGAAPVRRGAAKRGQRRPAAPPAIEVVGRVGLSRGSMAVALRFGDSVVLVGVSEQAPSTVLREMDAERWDEIHAEQDWRVPEHLPVRADGLVTGRIDADGKVEDSIIGPRPSFVDALREATTRRA
jgi:hypothetical protein